MFLTPRNEVCYVTERLPYATERVILRQGTTGFTREYKSFTPGEEKVFTRRNDTLLTRRNDTEEQTGCFPYAQERYPRLRSRLRAFFSIIQIQGEFHSWIFDSGTSPPRAVC